MSVIELKEKINSQINTLTETQDLEDLYETICLFFENRQVKVNFSPEFLKNIENRATRAQAGEMDGIKTQQLEKQMQQWLTK